MAYNPATGQWEDEDTGVATRLTGLLSSDNPYMKQAETIGKQAANRRGLLNSSIAVTGIEDARIRAALPIASQDAGQAHEREIQGRNLQSGDIQQTRGIASQELMQGRDITSREALTREGFAHDTELQGADIANRERMQQAGFGHETGLQTADIANRQWLAQFDAATQERLQTLDAQTRQLMQGIELEQQQRIANMNVASGERTSAASVAASLEQSYAQMIASITNNESIPAAERQALLTHASRMRDSNLALVEQFYAIDLDWGPAATAPAAALPATPAPAAQGGFRGLIDRAAGVA